MCKSRLSHDMIGRDAVDAGIERREVVARVDERLIFEDLPAVPKTDNSDLAYAADA